MRDASNGPATIEAWWKEWPDANIGIATGAVSGFIAVDVDPRHEGDDALAILEAKHGKLPDTVEALTGGGGRHILLRAPPEPVANSVAKLGPGLDVRSDGGYIVVPPSLHFSGKTYEWEGSSRPNEVGIAPAPEWLRQRISARPAATVPLDPGPAAPGLAHWREYCSQPWREGERNDRVARWAGYLLSKDLDPVVTLDIVSCINRVRGEPPLPEEELGRTVESIWQREMNKRLKGYAA